MNYKSDSNQKGIDVKKMIKSILNEDLTELYNESIVRELSEYKPKITNPKARRIYIKCLKTGKLELATKIDRLYDLSGTGDDMFMAVSIALLADAKK